MSDDAQLLRAWAAQAADLKERLRSASARREEWAYEAETARPGRGGRTRRGGGGSHGGGRAQAGAEAGRSRSLPAPQVDARPNGASAASSGRGPVAAQTSGMDDATGFSSGSAPGASGPGRAFGQYARAAGRGPQPNASATLVARGYAPAVVKVVSYAAGGTRAKATAQYVLRDEVELETHDGRTLRDSAAVNAEVDVWAQRFGKREPTQDVMGIRVGIMGLRDVAEDRGQLRRAVEAGFSGHRYAYRLEAGPDGSLSAHVVTAAAGAGRERFRVVSERIGEAADGFERRILDAPSEARIKARMAEAAGIELHRTQLEPFAPGHGIEAVRHRLDRLVTGGPAVRDDGHLVSSVAEAHDAARAWRPHLRSQQARDTMHLVVSARAGTDKTAFRDAVRDFLADRFADHAFLFGLHTDREEDGHIHAHAVIAVRGVGGAKIHPGPQDFRQWRERYAEHAQAQGLRVVATTALERASSQSYGRRDKAIVAAADRPRPEREAGDRTYASRPANRAMIDRARERMATARSNPVKVPAGSRALAATAAAAREWAVLAQAEPSNVIAAHYAQRTEDAYRRGEQALAQQAVQSAAEPRTGAPTMAVTSTRMEADLKLMNQQAAATADKLDGPARERYEAVTANILQASAARVDLQRLLEQGQTHIDLATVRAMLPPERVEAIIERTQALEAQDRAATQVQDGAPSSESASARSGTVGDEAPAADQNAASRTAAREAREAEAAERLERAAFALERAGETVSSQAPEASEQIGADRQLARDAAQVADHERRQADQAQQRARAGTAGAAAPIAAQGQDEDPAEMRRRVLQWNREEHEAAARARQAQDEQEME